MATARKADIRKTRQVRSPPSSAVHAAVVQSARDAGLLEGERSTHVSFRAPPALVEAAMRQTGVTSPSELEILALAALAQPDPVATFMRKSRGRLGKAHALDGWPADDSPGTKAG